MLGKIAAPKMGTTRPATILQTHRSQDGASPESVHTVLVMPERSFVILRYDGKAPAMACCAKCQHKFFTPSDFRRDRAGAAEYLRDKFVMHTCREEPKK